MAENAESSVSLKLYEAQFFGFTPQTCLMRVNSAFQDCLYEMLVVVESVFVRKLSQGKDAPEELSLKTRECTQKLLQFLQERFRKLSSRMEALLVNSVLSVPANVLLPDDEAQRKYPQSQDRLLKLEASTAELQQAYQAEVCARQALLAELEEQRETQAQLEEVLTWVEELRLAWKQGGMGNIRDSFKRMMQTVTQLQSVMDEIKKKSKVLDEV
ncbi:protein MIS12 homolog isoform X2 [Electrophorus electricus]|uniref:protein MIS12 homolog isoform X2 n=1 Tax=Electrophorus electricus TaxID=8005 RepID=UPI0015D031B2|nr:protein MIS12 homolog isoform X2 [Electrophorus electricus]